MSRAVRSRVWMGLTLSLFLGCVELSGELAEELDTDPDAIEVAPTPVGEADEELDDEDDEQLLDAGDEPEPAEGIDAGVSTDAGDFEEDEPDAALAGEPVPPKDAGVQPPPVDAGPTQPVPDAGPSVPDAGPSVPDAGPSVPDAGPSVPDAGPSVPDAGPSVPDAGPSVPDAGPPAEPTEPATFTRVFEIFRQACRGCHTPQSTYGLDLGTKASAYRDLVGGPNKGASAWPACWNSGHYNVIPFDPDGSLLVQKLEKTQPCGSPMPLGGTMAPALTKEIRSWIAAGALND